MTGVRSLGHGRLLFNIGGGNYRVVADVDYVTHTHTHTTHTHTHTHTHTPHTQHAHTPIV